MPTKRKRGTEHLLPSPHHPLGHLSTLTAGQKQLYGLGCFQGMHLLPSLLYKSQNHGRKGITMDASNTNSQRAVEPAKGGGKNTL